MLSCRRWKELRLHNTNLQQQVDSWQELLHIDPGVTVAADVPRGEAVACVAALESSLAAAERSLKAAQSQTNDKQAELNTNHSHIRRLELKVSLRVLRPLQLIVSASATGSEGSLKTCSLPTRLEKEVTSLGKQVALLESRVGRGNHNPGTTKVLQLSRNPDKDTAAQSELEQLRARVQQLEAQLAGTGESGAGGSAAGLQKRVDELEKKVKDIDKQKARYMQVFSDKITSFREACCLLFGYTMEMGDRVVMRGNVGGGGGAFVNTFTLCSISAEGSHETLSYQGSPGKALEFVPTDYSQRPEVMRQVATFINRCNSIPAFTANLTVELFSKYTIS
eukprot:jgi/Chlat1/5497/Chrsp360S00405